MKIPLGLGTYKRADAQEPLIPVQNRFFEQNPTNQEGGTALLVRPALKRWLSVGSGPNRAVYSQPGSFEDALFTVSYDELYRIDTDETTTLIGTAIFGTSLTASVSMAATANIGATPAYLFVADGRILWLYDETGPTFTQVATPDDVGIISVGFIGGYIICVVAQGYGQNGRFYWIEPGATTIDPLNFATAERSPDPLWEVVVVGDQFWLPGSGSTEVWYLSGDPDAPMIRVQGRLFDRGTWEGTARPLKDSVIIVDRDGAVYEIGGGAAERISNPSIEERIRKAQIEQLRLTI